MKIIKILLIIAVIAAFVGFIFFMAALAAGGWDIRTLSTVVIEDKTYEENTANEIQSITVKYDNADIKVTEGDTFSVKYPVKYTKSGKAISKISVRDNGGTLYIEERVDAFRQIVGGLFDFTNPVIEITVPKGRVTSLRLETDNGDVFIIGGEATEFKNIGIETDNSDTVFKNVSAESILLETDNGDAKLENVKVSGAIDIETSNGEVDFYGTVAAGNIKIDTDNGEISAENGVIDAKVLEIETDNGDVEIKLAGKKEDYSVTVKTDNGDKNISNSTGGERILNIRTDNGDVEVYFAN